MKQEFSGRNALWLMAASITGVACKLNAVNIIFFALLLLFLVGNWKRVFGAIGIALLAFLLTPITKLVPIQAPISFDGVGDVTWMPRGASNGEVFVLRTLEGQELLTTVRGDQRISLGDRIHVTGKLGPLNEASERIWITRGIVGALKVEGKTSTISEGNSFWYLGLTARKSFVKFIDSSMDKPASGCVDGICFNVDSGMSPELLDDLRASGTIHIISASGLHVVILVAILSRLFVFLPVPRWAQIALLAALLLAYVAAAGMRAPALRSAVMGIVPLFAYMFRREGDMLSAFGIAGSVFTLLDPLSILDIGFQLSFAIIGALLLFAPFNNPPPLQPLETIKFRAKQMLQCSLIASIAAAPLTAYHFGMFSTVSIVANLFVVPVVEVLMILALTAWALMGLFAPLAAFIAAGIVQPLAGWIIFAAHAFASVPFATIYVPPFSAYWVVAVYGIGLMFWRPDAKRLEISAAR